MLQGASGVSCHQTLIMKNDATSRATPVRTSEFLVCSRITPLGEHPAGTDGMLGPADIIRAARLAVARYGAEPVGVQGVLQTVMAAQARGDTADLFDALVAAELLSARQAQDLRG